MRALDLGRAEDLVCRNIMCEKLLEPCICRLSRAMERLPHLEFLSLRQNRIAALPASIWSLGRLRYLDLSGNPLPPASLGGIEQLRSLEVGSLLPHSFRGLPFKAAAGPPQVLEVEAGAIGAAEGTSPLVQLPSLKLVSCHSSTGPELCGPAGQELQRRGIRVENG